MRRVSTGFLTLALVVGLGMGCASPKKPDTAGQEVTYKCAQAGCDKTKTAAVGAPAPS